MDQNRLRVIVAGNLGHPFPSSRHPVPCQKFLTIPLKLPMVQKIQLVLGETGESKAATMRGHVEVVRVLLEAGADKSKACDWMRLVFCGFRVQAGVFWTLIQFVRSSCSCTFLSAFCND